MRDYAGEKEETEEARAETGTGKAAVRRNREEKERKNRKLSSKNRKRSGRKEVDWKGKARRRKQKGGTGGTAVGAKPGRMKGNKQKAEYLKMEGKHGKPGGTEVEEQGSRKAERQHLKSSCEARQGRRGKEEAEAE